MRSPRTTPQPDVRRQTPRPRAFDAALEGRLAKQWMRDSIAEDRHGLFVDRATGEVNATKLAEEYAVSIGETQWLDDELHPIWDWALEVADQSGYGHRANVSARNGAGFGEADMRRIRGEQFAKRRAGRIVRDVDALQERLGEELLLGQLVELDGEVYRVGGFQGDKVELWRESRAGHTPNAESEIEYPIWGIPPGKTEEDLLYTRARTMEEAKRVCRILETEHGVTRPRIQVLNLTEPPDFSNVLAGRRHRSNGAPGLTATDLRKMRVGDEVNVPCGPAGENLFIKRTKRDEFFIRIPGHEHARWGTAQQAADDIEQFVQYGALPRSSGARMF